MGSPNSQERCSGANLGKQSQSLFTNANDGNKGFTFSTGIDAGKQCGDGKPAKILHMKVDVGTQWDAEKVERQDQQTSIDPEILKANDNRRKFDLAMQMFKIIWQLWLQLWRGINVTEQLKSIGRLAGYAERECQSANYPGKRQLPKGDIPHWEVVKLEENSVCSNLLTSH